MDQAVEDTFGTGQKGKTIQLKVYPNCLNISIIQLKYNCLHFFSRTLRMVVRDAHVEYFSVIFVELNVHCAICRIQCDKALLLTIL
jgi:hypothetical protein